MFTQKFLPEYRRNTIYLVDAKQTKFNHHEIQKTQKQIIDILLKHGFEVVVFTKEPASWENQRNLYLFLSGTITDIWIKDYCPTSFDSVNFISFKYSPNYYKYKQLFREKLLAHVFTSHGGYNVQISDIRLEGGNLVFDENILFITDKVLKQNPTHFANEKECRHYFKRFGLDLTLIPVEPNDFVGHVDGIIRVLPNKRILIPDGEMSNLENTRKYYKEIEDRIKHLSTDYKIYKVPYLDYEDKKYYHNIYSAENCYMNFIILPNVIILPMYSNQEFNKKVVKYFKRNFIDFKIETVHSVELAKYGGSINCITGTI